LGVLTILTSAAYFIGFGLVFVPGFELWSKVFVPRVLLFLYIPLLICGVYFFTRVQLGRWMLEDGATDLVRQWCEPRIVYNFWLRGRREALIQRVVLVQAMMRDVASPEEIEPILWPEDQESHFPERAPEHLELLRWRMEYCLRHDDLIRAREAFELGRELFKPRVERAALLASLAEVELRSRKEAECKQLLKEAEWADPTSRRARFVEILRVIRDEDASAEQLEDAAKELEEIRPDLDVRVPGRAPELLVEQARLLRRIGGEENETRARECLEEARERALVGKCDARARLILEGEFGERLLPSERSVQQEEEEE
jgi:hypothetical protein